MSRLPLCLLVAGVAFAQNNNGRISGTVTDVTGSVIAGASVSVVNVDTKIFQKVSTDSAGFYVAPDLAVGNYSVTAEAKGFKKVEKTGYSLNDRGTLTVDFKLDVGSITDTITV